MKKLISLLMALTIVAMMAACAPSNNETTEPSDTTEATDATEVTDATDATDATDITEENTPADTTTLQGIIDAIYAINPVEFMAGSMPVDVTDTSEDGLWALKNYTGLTSAELITEAVASEAMIGSIPYSLVLVRVADPANAEAVANEMASNIDQRKWICVTADDLMTTYSGDVVMLIMIGSENGAAQPFVDAFNQVMGK